jgi:hypothetical protein
MFAGTWDAYSAKKPPFGRLGAKAPFLFTNTLTLLLRFQGVYFVL